MTMNEVLTMVSEYRGAAALAGLYVSYRAVRWAFREIRYRLTGKRVSFGRYDSYNWLAQCANCRDYWRQSIPRGQIVRGHVCVCPRCGVSGTLDSLHTKRFLVWGRKPHSLMIPIPSEKKA